MNKFLSLLVFIISLPAFACDSGEYDRVREAAMSSRECLAKYVGVTLAIGMGGIKDTHFFQEKIGIEINSLVSEEDLQNLNVNQIEKLGTEACNNLAYSSFHSQFCKDAATSLKTNPAIVEEVYCSAQSNLKFSLCR